MHHLNARRADVVFGRYEDKDDSLYEPEDDMDWL
jgi:hypothetical protein